MTSATVTPLRSTGLDFDEAVQDWQDHLRAEHKSENTVATYGHAARSLREYLTGRKASLDVSTITKRLLEGWQRHLLANNSDATANNYFRGARSLFQWLADEGELPVSPMANMKAPTIGEKLTAVISTDNLVALIDSCRGNTYEDLRDMAILRLFIDSGCRLAELTNVTLDDVDKANKLIRVVGKGNKERRLSYGSKAAQALNRYLRARARHPYTDHNALWLGRFGPMTRSGLYQLVRRRARTVGFTIHPHQFRHTFAHEWLLAGGTEGDLMALCGWNDSKMLHRYGKSAAAERARVAHGKFSIGERI